MRSLVCGGRDYLDGARLREVLDSFPIEAVIRGAAPGADMLADKWAKERGKIVEAFPEDWNKHGRAAGPIRNAEMLAVGKPDCGIAFPGGRGTMNMVTQAQKAGVQVYSVQ